jgi:hypothetical protein
MLPQANAPDDPDCIRRKWHRTSPESSAQYAYAEENAPDHPEGYLAQTPLLWVSGHA